MKADFRDWWMREGYNIWRDEIDSNGGTLGAIELVFKAGVKAGLNERNSSIDPSIETDVK